MASGIVLGVATLFGTMVAGSSVQDGVDRVTNEINGPSDVVVAPVGAWDSTLPDSSVARAAALADVDTASGSLWRQIRAVVPGVDHSLDIAVGGVGADVQKIANVSVITGRLAGPGADEIAISAETARRLAVSTGGSVRLHALSGDVDAKVVGVIADSGIALVNDKVMALTSLTTAQRIDTVQGVGGIDIALRSGTDVDRWIGAHGAELPGTNMRPASDANSGFAAFFTVLRSSLTLSAMLALFVGAFLIYLTLSVAVVERTRTYGTLRAVGTTPRQLRRVVLAESLTLGVPGTVAGLVLGAGLAWVLIGLLSSLVHVPRPGLMLQPSAIVAGVVVGVGATAVASLVPARRAARISPVVAMKGNIEAGTRLSRSWIAGLIIFTIGIGLSRAASGAAGSSGGSLLALIGAVLLVPPLLRPLSRLVGVVSRRLAPGVGSMAVTHLGKERSRSAYTLALVMVVLAQVLVIATVTSSLKAAFNDVLSHQFGFDVEVFHDFGTLRPTTAAMVASTPGVARMSELRFGRTQYLDRAAHPDVSLLVIDPSTYFGVQQFAWKDGDDTSARQALAKGGAILLDEPFARSFGLHKGDSVTLRTDKGAQPFAVAGVFRSFQRQLVVGLADGRSYFGAGPANAITVDGVAGTNHDQLKRALDRRIGVGADSSGDEVWTAAQYKQRAFGQLNGFTSIFFAVVGVALIAGLLGLANTLAMSVVQRTREIGVLRAVGTTPRQIVSMVLVESVTMSLVAVVLAIPLGLLISSIFTSTAGASFGLSSQYTFPWLALPVILVIALVVALGAAIAPARRAGRVQIVQALQFE
jgi:putative ABC transport system permease protein